MCQELKSWQVLNQVRGKAGGAMPEAQSAIAKNPSGRAWPTGKQDRGDFGPTRRRYQKRLEQRHCHAFLSSLRKATFRSPSLLVGCPPSGHHCPSVWYLSLGMLRGAGINRTALLVGCHSP